MIYSKWVIVACFVAGVGGTGYYAFANSSAAPSVESATELVKEKCKEGCLILSKEDVANLNIQIDAAMEEAFNRGLHTCRNSI